MDRVPLQPLPDDWPEKLQLQRERGLNPDNTRVRDNLTSAERRAARDPGLPDPLWMEKHMETQPVVSQKAAAVLAPLGLLLGLVAGGASVFPFLPSWAPFVISVAGAICLWLAGQAFPGLKVGGPLLPEGVGRAFIAASGSIGAFATTLTPGKLQGGLLLLAAILAGLAGVAEKQAMKAA